jgi:hypothetical protein
VASRTALYRVGVDGGLFLGPFLAGISGAYVSVLTALVAAGLLTLAILVVARAR